MAGGWSSNHFGSPVGVGAVSLPTNVGQGEQALAEMLKTLSPVLLTPWASQEGSVDWSPVKPEWTVAVLPVKDQQLKVAQAAAFGHPVGLVAVLCQKPVTYQLAEAAFASSPYEMFGADAMYRQDDPKPTPRIWFLYWGQLRGDASGGKTSMDAVAARLNGTLVFPTQLPLTGRERQAPALPFATALNTQLPPAGVVNIQAAPPPGMLAKSSASSVPWPLLVLVGGAAIGTGIWLVNRRKKRSSQAGAYG